MSFMENAVIIRKPPFFSHIRTNDWKPAFHWEKSLTDVAYAMNQPHEELVKRELGISLAVKLLSMSYKKGQHITSDMIREAHKIVFPDHGEDAGQWRKVNVKVADHIPPNFEYMDKMMVELEESYRNVDMSVYNLEHWYYDLETIHPYRDGNGRVGGIIMAVVSHSTYGSYRVPGQ